MKINLSQCVLRSWAPNDADSLVQNANNRNIWLHLRDLFPSPYTKDEAEKYLAGQHAQSGTVLAIEVAGKACGNISATIQTDVHRYTAEIGYWLGEPYWGRGIMSEAVGAFTDYLFEHFALHRIFAVPFSNHPASARILEKNGFTLEGRMKRSAFKNGELLDQFLYAKIR